MDKRPSDPVKAALAGAQRISRTSLGRRRRPKRGAEPTQPGRTTGGYSGAWPDEADPKPIGEVVANYLVDRGWERPIAEARVFTDWVTIVGPGVAAHCQPSSLRDGELRISAESTAWATQLRILSATMLAHIVAELGPHLVTRIVITGPLGPSWKHGAWSVRGARGPRDTYG